MSWIFPIFVFLLPFYVFRFSIVMDGAVAQIPFIEMAAYGIAAVMVFRDPKTSLQALKKAFFETKGNTLLFFGLVLLWIGLIIGIFQSNDALASVGIVRGWFLAPCVWFLALIILKKREQLDSALALAFAFSAGIVSAISLFSPHFNQDARMAGFYISPNYLAMYVAPLIPFVAYQAYCAHRRFTGVDTVLGYSKKYGWFFILGLCFAAIFFSFSFGSWLGLAVATGFVASVALFRFHTKIFSLAAFFCVSAAVIAVVLFHARLIEKIHSRLGLWQAAWNMGVMHPFLGIGEGMFQTAYQLQKHIIPYPVPLESALHPHNLFFTFWLYAGLPGFIGFFCILVWIGREVYRRFKKTPADFFTVAVASSFIIILVHGLVDTTYWKNDLAFMWWTLMGLLI